MDTDIVQASVRKTKFKACLILIFLSFFYFLLIHYPSVGDAFDYWHMARAMNIQNTGYVSGDQSNLGYYIIISFLSIISNISYEFIPMLPLLLIQFALILIIVIGITSESQSQPSFSVQVLILIYLTRFCSFTIWAHGLGFLLFISLFYTLFLIYKKNSDPIGLSIISIILLISLNYVSYKMTFLAIALIIFFQIYIILFFGRMTQNSKTDISRRRQSLFSLSLIGIIHILTYNFIFFKFFLAKARINLELESTGIDKLIFRIYGFIPEPISEYYFREDFNVICAYGILAGVLILCLSFVMINLTKRYIYKDLFRLSDIAFLSLITASAVLIIIYIFFGYFEIGLIFFCGVMAFPLFSEISRRNSASIVTVIVIFILFFSHSYAIVESLNDNLYIGQDVNQLQYLSVPAQWIISHAYFDVKTDVFTGGFMTMELTKLHWKHMLSDNTLESFSHEDMVYLFNLSHVEQRNKLFIFNNKLKRFSALDWEVFAGWRKHNKILKSNSNLNYIYSTDYINIGFANHS